MWRRFKNVFNSVETYSDLSPDLHARQRVSQTLSDRPALGIESWFSTYWQPLGIEPAVARFAYTRLKQYSGLPSARLRPEDCLEADLNWTAVCWFDWEVSLCEDFGQCFGIDWSDRLEEFAPTTVADLLGFLQSCVCPAVKPAAIEESNL